MATPRETHNKKALSVFQKQADKYEMRILFAIGKTPDGRFHFLSRTSMSVKELKQLLRMVADYFEKISL